MLNPTLSGNGYKYVCRRIMKRIDREITNFKVNFEINYKDDLFMYVQTRNIFLCLLVVRLLCFNAYTKS